MLQSTFAFMKWLINITKHTTAKVVALIRAWFPNYGQYPEIQSAHFTTPQLIQRKSSLDRSLETQFLNRVLWRSNWYLGPP